MSHLFELRLGAFKNFDIPLIISQPFGLWPERLNELYFPLIMTLPFGHPPYKFKRFDYPITPHPFIPFSSYVTHPTSALSKAN
jgi:hypothetical protein